MMASPKSKEYAGRIAPPDKVGLYMGYFYLCVALGNLFGGLLSGTAYQYLGPRGLDRPDRGEDAGEKGLFGFAGVFLGEVDEEGGGSPRAWRADVARKSNGVVSSV